ncbi:MAG TPA: lysophospholipid acyltransferase family protein [Candidatus Paceibacterota bacterium]
MNPLYNISPLILQKIIWIPTRIILKFFIHLEIVGLEKLEDIKDNVIFASNHTSEIDPILLPASLPFFSRFSPIFFASLSKDKYINSGWRKTFYGGFFFRLWGAHPIYIGLKDYGRSLVNHTRLLESGKNLFYFPEGRITPDGNIGPARGGVTYLMKHTGHSIVPILISGTYGMKYSDFLLRRRYVKVVFGKEIKPSELKDNNYKKEAEEVMEKVRGLINL